MKPPRDYSLSTICPGVGRSALSLNRSPEGHDAGNTAPRGEDPDRYDVTCDDLQPLGPQDDGSKNDARLLDGTSPVSLPVTSVSVRVPYPAVHTCAEKGSTLTFFPWYSRICRILV